MIIGLVVVACLVLLCWKQIPPEKPEIIAARKQYETERNNRTN
jgi:hypothetical protein